MSETWQRIVSDVHVDYHQLHADIERVMKAEGKTFEQAIESLPVGTYLTLKKQPADGAD